MKTKDYLHSDLLAYGKNNSVFNKTYALIEELSEKITKIECIAFDVTDKDSIETLRKINAIWLSDELIEVVNYAIENFNKKAGL